MTRDEIKQLKITLNGTITIPLMDDITEEYLDTFLNDFIPEVYNKSWEKMTEEEITNAMQEFNYSDHYELKDLMDSSEIEVKIWK